MTHRPAGAFAEPPRTNPCDRSTSEFLSHVRSLGIRISLDQGQLQISAPKNLLTEELRREFKVRKAELVAFLDSSRQARDGAAIRPIPRDGDLPVSSAQLRLWFLDQLTPGSPAYVIPVGARFRGKLDPAILERSLSEIVRRHEILRTVFPAGPEALPKSVILPPAPVIPEVTNLAKAPDKESRLEEIFQAAVTKPFHLGTGPLLRSHLVRMGEDDHVLLLTVHHAVFDGWSLTVLWREFASLYTAFHSGQPSPLPELPVQYVDFAAWQQSLDASERDSYGSFWRKQLENCIPVLDLPADRPRAPQPVRRSAQQIRECSAPVTDALRKFGNGEGASLFMTLLGAFNVLLYRLTGQTDILVGSPIAGRNRPELEDLIGFFVNAVVIRTRLLSSDSFQSLMAQVRNTVLDAYAHQNLPFEELVREFDPERDLTRPPLFQVFFNHLNMPAASITLPGLTVETFAGAESKYDLTLYSMEREGGIFLKLLYDPDLFDERRMSVLLDQYVGLLEQICQDPSRPLSDYSLVTPAIASCLPDPAEPLENRWCGAVHEKFMEHAARVPERTAVVDSDFRWSYRRLAEAGAVVAGWLREHNVGAGDVVAVYGARCGAFVAALVGILRAGAVFCVLDPAYPASRLAECLKAAKAKAWIDIGNPRLPALLEEAVEATAGPVRLSMERIPKSAQSTDFVTPAVCSHSPAYVTFTSGTTGGPKCILGTHGPLSHFLDWHARHFGLTEHDCFSMLSGLAHDPLLRDIFTPLWLGATLSIPPEDEIFSGDLAEWMQQAQVTVSHLTPAMANLLVQAGRRGALPALRYAFLGGDVITALDCSRLGDLAPMAKCVCFYGATETPQAMAWHPADGENGRSAAMPAGRPIPDVQLLVLNSAGILAGPGELGEIYVRTPYLTSGYINDEALTKARYLINSFTGDPNDRMYRTGDLGRYHPDGFVEFAGRRDEQVKIRGYRIHLGEIKTALARFPGISDCCVLPREVTPGDKQLLAYIVCPEQAPDLGELRSCLKKTLPEYMIPAAFFRLRSIPLTPNGKVDVRALLARHDTPALAADRYVPPGNEMERIMTGIWQDVLSLERVGITENFFEIGGHSLAATRLIARLQTAFSLALPLRCIFLEPTISGLARHIRLDAASGTYSYLSEIPRWTSLVPAQPHGKRTPFFFVAGYQNPDDTLLILSRIIRHLGQDQPVFGLRPSWLEHGEEEYSNVEELARQFLTEIRAVQPKGPYLLGGHCVGGIAALEVARQLEQMGEEVGLLLLLDTERPNPQRAFYANLRVLDRRLRNITGVLRELAFPPEGSTRKNILSAVIGRKLRSPQSNYDPLYEKKMRYRRLLYNHSPGDYSGPITLVVNEEQSRFDADLGWKAYAGDRLAIHKLPGTHFNLLEEHGDKFAKVLQQSLDDASAASGRGVAAMGGVL